jgi:peptidoglycan/LPS O-acetylase OafA/YrhL
MTFMPTQSSQSHIVGHHALRGIAAIAVAVMHLQLATKLGMPSVQSALTFWANEAVDLFFILSGFIFAYIYCGDDSPPVDWKEFFVARFARIYPVYLLTMTVIVALDLLTFVRYGAVYGSLVPQRLVFNILGVQAWFGHATSESINLPSWSVSSEIFLYLVVFPILVMTHLSVRLTARFAALIFVACALLMATCYAYGELHTPPRPLLRGVAGFLAGFCLCSILRQRAWNCPHAGFAAAAGILLVVLSAHTPVADYGLVAKVSLWFGLLLVVYGTFDNNAGPGSLLSGRLFHWLGTISYSLYLWHIPLETLLRRVLKFSRIGSPYPENENWFAVLLATGVLAVSTASYYWFEDPARRRIRRWFRRAKGKPVLVQQADTVTTSDRVIQ